MADDDERTVVKTYVPRSQKEAWVDHAESLGMSQSEFLRTMVQAGRRGFDPDPADAGSPDATPGGESLEEQVLSAVSEAGVVGWEELLDRLTGDVERDVDEALGALQDRGEVRYSGRHGGYVAAGGPPAPDDHRDRRAPPNRRGDAVDVDRSARDDANPPRDPPRGRGEPAPPSDGGDRRPRGRSDGRPGDDRSDERRAGEWETGGRGPADRPRRDGRRADERRIVDDVSRPSERPRRDPPRRGDRRRPPDRRSSREDDRTRVDALREARESLDAPDEGQWEEERSPERPRPDRLSDEERYDEY